MPHEREEVEGDVGVFDDTKVPCATHEPLPPTTRIRWQAREFMGTKLLVSAACTFALDFVLCEVLRRLTAFALLWLVILVPLSPTIIGFCLGFVEQRLRRHLSLGMVSATSGLGALGLFIVNTSRDEIATAVAILWPIMFVVYMFGALLGIACSRARYRIVIGVAGRCQNCGYDLTGNVSGRCPECGTPVQERDR